MVEFALIVGLLALLLVIAVDFGRVFFGWVGVHNASRVAANFAATHPDADWTNPADPDVVAYVELVQNDAAGLNCQPNPIDVPMPEWVDEAGDPVADPEFGDLAVVALTCEFQTIVPMDPFRIGAASTFPVRAGMIAGVPVGGAIPPTAPNCEVVPDLTGLTLVQARYQWSGSGFTGALIPASGADDELVTGQATNPTSTPGGCIAATATVTVTHEPPPPGCSVVPSMAGMTVTDARDAWNASFTGAFSPAIGQDTQVVNGQTTDPLADPGDCVDETTTVTVTHEAPPVPECEVPEFIRTKKNVAQREWSEHEFTTGVTLSPNPNGNWTIGAQTLVGGSSQPCNSTITLSPVP
jgi:hypothetical protein